mgnify:CR=1 FL=1
MNPSPKDEATEKQADAPAEAVPVNPPAECPEESGDSVGVQTKEEVPMHSESVLRSRKRRSRRYLLRERRIARIP